MSTNVPAEILHVLHSLRLIVSMSQGVTTAAAALMVIILSKISAIV